MRKIPGLIAFFMVVLCMLSACKEKPQNTKTGSAVSTGAEPASSIRLSDYGDDRPIAEKTYGKIMENAVTEYVDASLALQEDPSNDGKHSAMTAARAQVERVLKEAKNHGDSWSEKEWESLRREAARLNSRVVASGVQDPVSVVLPEDPSAGSASSGILDETFSDEVPESDEAAPSEH